MEPLGAMDSGPAPAEPFTRVGIVGVGLIGGSIAMRARLAWPGVSIVGVYEDEVLRRAIAKGVIDHRRSGIRELADCDVVVLAAPVRAIVTALPEASRLPGVVTDVGSTKREIMRAAAGAGLTSFVGGHPMAGAEQGGLDHARTDLFERRPWLLVNGAAFPAVASLVEAFVIGLGARPKWIDAESHDRTMAYVSHLPQLLSLALMACAGDTLGEDGLAISGQGFADMTRLSASPFEVWQGILETNADAIAGAIEALRARLPSAASELRDTARMSDLFESARDWHARRGPGYSRQR